MLNAAIFNANSYKKQLKLKIVLNKLNFNIRYKCRLKQKTFFKAKRSPK